MVASLIEFIFPIDIQAKKRLQTVKKFILLILILASVFGCKPETQEPVDSSNFIAGNSVENHNMLIVPDFKGFTNSSCANGGIEIRNQNSHSTFPFWSTCQKILGTEKRIEATIEAYFSDKISSLPTLNDPDLSKYFCLNPSLAIQNFFSNKSPLISLSNEPNSTESNCHSFFSTRFRLQKLELDISNKTSVAPLKFTPRLRELNLKGDSALAEVEGLHLLSQLETLHLKSLRFNFAEVVNLKNLKSLHIDNIDINLALTDLRYLRSKQGLKNYSGNMSELSIKNSILLESALISISSIQSLIFLELKNNQLKNIAQLAELKGLLTLRLYENPNASLIDMIKIINSTDLFSLHFNNEARKLTSHPLPLSYEN